MINDALIGLRSAVNLTARGASLIVTDRRWGAILSAAALGFGLFVGVAIGPGASGTFATGSAPLIALAGDGGGEEGGEAAAAPVEEAEASAQAGTPLGLGGEAEPQESYAPAVLPTSGSSAPTPPAEAPSSQLKAPPASEGGEEEAETTALSGTVVHVNRPAGSYALAIAAGELVAVHAAKPRGAGTKLSLEGLLLANGTFAEEGPVKLKGKAAEASFGGLVTHVAPDPLAPAYTVSGRGASLRVSVPPDPTGALPPLPLLGAYVTVEAAIEADGSLVQRKLETDPLEPSTYLELAGIYAGLAPDTGLLLISSDDTRAGGQDLSLVVPPTIDASKLKPGDSYIAAVKVEPDGSLVLAGIAGDEYRKGADDADSAQGDLKR